jgi:hypothetical protein
MKTNFLLISIIWISGLFVSLPDATATSINASGTISVNTTWSGVDTVKVTGNITINNGITLTINSGICVYFTGYYQLYVQGRLLAVGTENNQIKFTAADQNTGWDRIWFNNPSDANDTTKIIFCILEYGKASGQNYDDRGGAIWAYSFSKVLVSNTIFQYNYSPHHGGAIYCWFSNIQFKNCIFRNNSADLTAGAMDLHYSSPNLVNCLFTGNQCSSNVATSLSLSNSSPVITNCTFAGENGDCTVKCESNSDPEIRNSVFWNGLSCQFNLADDNSDPNFYYCNIRGGLSYGVWVYSGTFTGAYTECINSNSQFIGSGLHLYDLQQISPCINAGDPATTTIQVGTTDLRGGTRIADGRVDIGAYEGKLPSGNVPGNCLDFDGTNDYVNISNLSTNPIGNTLTIECWVKPNNLSGRQGVFSTRFNNAAGSFQLEAGIAGNGINRLAVSGISTWVAQTGDNVLIPDEWNHIAYTRSGTGAGTHILYVNGVAQTLISDADYTFIDNTSNKVIGSGTNNAQFFNGKIEEMRVWSVVRTEQQIRESMHHPYIGNETGLTAYWKFNEQSGTSAADDLGNITGTTVNMDNSDWVVSTIPYGPGAVSSKTEANGLVDFTGTRLTINYSAQTGASVTVTRIDNAPDQVPVNGCVALDDQYWVLNRYGSGSYNGTLTFTINENLYDYDETNITGFKLYRRNGYSDNVWALVDSAISVDFTNRKIVFGNISSTGQFIICKKMKIHGYPGATVDFAGIDNYISCGNNSVLNPVTAITVEAWINADTWKTNYWQGTIVGKDNTNQTGYTLRCGNNGKLSFVIGKSPGWAESISAAVMQIGQWYHVAGVYDGTTISLYINGVLSGQQAVTGNIGISSNPLLIGESPGYPDRCFDGKIEEVRIWNVARTANQVREYMNIPLTSGSAGLVAYWQFNEGASNHIYDAINGIEGTFTNIDQNLAWYYSYIPFGKGASNSEIEAIGNIVFTGTDVSMNYDVQNGASVTVSRIDTLPNQLPSDPILDTVYMKQFWVINRFGTGNFNADITFTVGEDLTQTDLNNASGFHLYRREANSTGAWTLFAGSPSIDPVNDQITFFDISGFSQFMIAREPYVQGITVNLIANLQGPYNGTAMNTTLNSSAYLPLTQPYSLTPWNYSGTENVTAIPNVNIVDWVLVELRDAVDAASATSASVVAQQAAFILNNGTITGIDGVSLLSFMYTPVNSLFAVVYHRNTIAVMSSGPMTPSGSIYTWNFTTGADQAFGGTLGHKEIVPGIWGMTAGDGNADNQVNNSDKNNVWTPQSGTSGYQSGDFNLDGQVNNTDKNIVWKPNTGSGGQVPQ